MLQASSAFMLTGITHGKAGVRRLAQRLVLWGVNLIWYLIAILLVSVSEMLVAAHWVAGCPACPVASGMGVLSRRVLLAFLLWSMHSANKLDTTPAPGSGRVRAPPALRGGRLDRSCYDGVKAGLVCTHIGRVLKRALALSIRECHLFWPVWLPWAVRRGHRSKEPSITHRTSGEHAQTHSVQH